MSYMAVAGAMVMMVFGGIGVDMIHAELKRTKLQNTLDRAVLAAADLENVIPPRETVVSYLDAMSLGNSLGTVTSESALEYKRVTATGRSSVNSIFMDLIGVDSLMTDALSTAEEGKNKVEISLVLDISGSMKDNNKLQHLKNASQTFLDTVMLDENEGLVSVSLVPYSEHVNAGPDIAANLDVNWKHGFSHCLEFPDDQFQSAALDTSITYDQMQHFQWNYFGNNDRTDTVCPQYSYERIAPFSMDREALKSQIRQLQPRAGTSIFLGMKWGAALLDPSTRFIADSMTSAGDVDFRAAGRPVDYDDPGTIKTVVLMTDGQHDKSFRIQDWAYDSPAEISLWSRNNLWYYLVRNVHPASRGHFYTQKYSAPIGDGLLAGVCDAAKAQGIIVWTIGFEVGDHGANVMQQCASSPSHFFRVEGSAIEDAFYSIARTVNQLRLTQ